MFTDKIEKNSYINFLDVLVIKNEDCTVSIDLFKKSIASGTYINYNKNLALAKQELILNNYPKNFEQTSADSSKSQYTYR